MNSPVTPQPHLLTHTTSSSGPSSYLTAATNNHRAGTSTPTGSYLMPQSPANKQGSISLATTIKKPTVRRTTGSRPACLVNASITYCGDDKIYAFGGFDQFTDEVYNHVLRLDLKSLNWELVDNYGDIPGVRMGHSASLYEGSKLLIYGGENEHRDYLSDVIILDLKSHHWTQPEVYGRVPRGRARHATVIYEDKLFVIGGLAGDNNVLDEICYLDLKTWTWSKTWTFVRRYDHTAWIWGGRLWVLGGIGPELDRPTEIWWLDLKGVPALGINSQQGRIAGPLRATGHGDSSYLAQNGPYTANSTSIHINRRHGGPTAPGAISSLKFVSGPHVPSQSTGKHFHICSSGALLDFVTPSNTIRHNECNLSTLELDSLRWQRLVEGAELFSANYLWHYCTINEDGTKVWLLGSPSDDNVSNQDLQLSEVLSIDLRRYGLLGNDIASSSEQSRILASEQISNTSRGLGDELAEVFDRSPQSGSMTDFIITANLDDTYYDNVSDAGTPGDHTPRATKQPRFSTATDTSDTFISSSSSVEDTSQPIHVHKFLLRARWPHFRRLYESRMLEYQTNKLHIPEPYSVVRAFLYYLYSDSIAQSPYCRSLNDVAGLLVMAHLYDMPKLRFLCINRLSREIDVEHAAVIWERAGRASDEDNSESWLRTRAARFCLANWGRVVRTEGFRNLSRTSLMDLCEVVGTEGRVVSADEYEDDSAFGGFGAGSARGRAHRDSTTETEGDDDDVEMN